MRQRWTRKYWETVRPALLLYPLLICSLLESWKKHVDRQLDYLSHDSVVVSCKRIPWYAIAHEPYGTISQCNIQPFISYPRLTYAFQQPCKVSKDPRLINIHTTSPWLSSKYVSTTVQYTPEINTNDTKIFSCIWPLTLSWTNNTLPSSRPSYIITDLIGLESGDEDGWRGRRRGNGPGTNYWRNYTQYAAGSILWSAPTSTSIIIIIRKSSKVATSSFSSLASTGQQSVHGGCHDLYSIH